MGIGYSKESKDNFRKLYQDLMQEGDCPIYAMYRRYKSYPNHAIALQMCATRSHDGVPGLQAYIDELSTIVDREGFRGKPLVDILLKPEPEIAAGTLLSNVQPQKTAWLWHPRLALGKIQTLDGHPGLGKSLLLIDMAAKVTRGEAMPDGTPCLAAGGIVVIMPEDSLEDTILPRFARAGADLSKVMDLSVVEVNDDDDDLADEEAGDDEEAKEVIKRPFQLKTDLDLLEAAIRRVDAKLLIIDPIMALAGDTDMYKDDDVRTLLLPLKLLIEKLQVSCVLVRHLTKTHGDNPLMAGGGSVAFIGLARSGLMVTRHPEDSSQVILSHIKSNIGPLAPAITYTICSDKASGDDRPYIVWGSEISDSTSDLLASKRKTSKK